MVFRKWYLRHGILVACFSPCLLSRLLYTIHVGLIVAELVKVQGSLQSLDWNGGLEWWNGMVELQIQQK